MNEENNKNAVDVGSDPSVDDFDPFASEEDLDCGTTMDGNSSDDATAQSESAKDEAEVAKTAKAKDSSEQGQSTNPLEAAIGAAEQKDVQKTQKGLVEKLPVFEYAGATEDIDDISKTFEELRIEKSDDFPELQDGKRVTWTMEYGKLTKSVPDPKSTSIGKMKSDIEISKEFSDSLRKAKDKNPVCKVKPKVVAQTKGMAGADSGYKGVFINIDEAGQADKVISIVPGRDGQVYEIRKTEMGKFVTPTAGSELLSKIRAGFTPALPPIPKELLSQVVAFFRHLSKSCDGCRGSSGNGGCIGKDACEQVEALLNLYWDKQEKKYLVDAPKQLVSKASVKGRISEDFDSDRFIHYMDIHSHNTMSAFFSKIDDEDEKATRLYTVIGDLHKGIPGIKTRISNGGKFLEIDPGEVFELGYANEAFPQEWMEMVRYREGHDGFPWH